MLWVPPKSVELMLTPPSLLRSTSSQPTCQPGHHAGHAEEQRRPAAARSFFRSGVQQHDDKDKQHHDGAGINDHLNRGDKLRAQQQVDQRQRAITTTSESALLMGWRCTSRLIAPATQIRPK